MYSLIMYFSVGILEGMIYTHNIMEAKKTILIIDDERDFVDTIHFHLINSGFNVAAAYNGTEGIDKALENPDVILLDLNMPDMSGHEVCRNLKNSDRTRHIPIIMLTAQNQTLDKVQALNMGASDYICKTTEMEEIQARIKAVLRSNLSPEDRIDQSELLRDKIFLIREIIDNRHIRTVYQPIVELAGHRPMGFEALTRGPKDSELESPIKLFHAAAQLNMFAELDHAARISAIANASFLNETHLLFINTDPSIMDRPEFKDFSYLENGNIDPSQICLELTERTSVKDFAKFRFALDALKSSGFKIAIDDAGEGYASIRTIAEIKPNFIKLDMSIVRDIDQDTTKQNIAEFLVDMSKKLGTRLIAEGIETENEMRILTDIGADYGQGYFFSKPMEDKKDILAFLNG